MSKYEGLCIIPGLSPKVHCSVSGRPPGDTEDLPRDVYEAGGWEPRWQDLENCPPSLDEIGHAEGGDEA